MSNSSVNAAMLALRASILNNTTGIGQVMVLEKYEHLADAISGITPPAVLEPELHELQEQHDG